MNQQIQQSLTAFSNILSGRNSVLTDIDSQIALDKAEVIQRLQRAVLVPFEERCIETGKRKASWVFNRDLNKFILNRIYKSGNPQFMKC